MLTLSSVMKIRKLCFRYDLFYVRILLDTVYHRWSLQFTIGDFLAVLDVSTKLRHVEDIIANASFHAFPTRVTE